jgi:hypothetical protein
MMPLLLLLFQILFLARVTSSEHQRVTLGERRGLSLTSCRGEAEALDFRFPQFRFSSASSLALISEDETATGHRMKLPERSNSTVYSWRNASDELASRTRSASLQLERRGLCMRRKSARYS